MRDEWFIRGKVPMTKSEVRAVSISKLELKPDSILYDVGAGTGSVAIEASKFLTSGLVYAIEKKTEAVELIEKNKEKFSAHRLEIVKGMAPEAFKDLKTPTHVFIGGTSGNLEEILDLVLSKNDKTRIVVNVIALETLAQLVNWLKRKELEAEIIQMQVSRGKAVGGYHLMMGQNPVSVISFGGEEEY